MNYLACRKQGLVVAALAAPEILRRTTTPVTVEDVEISGSQTFKAISGVEVTVKAAAPTR